METGPRSAGIPANVGDKGKRNCGDQEMAKQLTVEERFWKFVTKTHSCWLWAGCKNRKGYGRFAVAHGNTVQAHRFAWSVRNGPAPEAMLVCHRCDTPNCVNPDHLFLGTPQDNSSDMVTKGRSKGPSLTGERNPAAKFTKKQIQAIRRLYVSSRRSQNELARDFGVSQSTVSRIVNFHNWRE